MEKEKNPPKPAKPASTVVLIREHDQELQVYLVRRSTTSGFFPGSYVFPGGALNPDDRDVEFWQKHLDLEPEELQSHFGPELAISELIVFGVAAVRETFEEAGIFLARKENHGNKTFDKDGLRHSTKKLGEDWIHRKVEEEGWTLSFSNLFPWSHWITPRMMPKRYDTRFFITFMPEGQECIPDDREIIHGLWANPIKGLQENMDGRILLSPPTLVTLHELSRFKSLNSLRRELRCRSWGEPRQPITLGLARGAVIIQPWDPDYGKPIEIDPNFLKSKVLPVEEPFSRLWLDGEIWRPIRATGDPQFRDRTGQTRFKFPVPQETEETLP